VEPNRTVKKPVAVVALGNPAMEDDGVAVRVMGRVRPVLGEIALTGKGADALAHRAGRSRSHPLTTEIGDAKRRKRDRDVSGPHALVEIVEWIEGLCPDELLRPVLQGRLRVVLIDAVSHDSSPGHVHHWHIQNHPKSGLHAISFYHSDVEDCLDHLPFWLEEDMPEHGTDLIAIEPFRIEPGNDLSPVLRSRLAGITAQVGGLLLRILEEEGWRFGPKANEPPKRAPRRRRAA